MWKDTFYVCAGRLNIVKMAIFPNMINRYNVTFVKIQTIFLQKWENWSQSSYGNTKDLVKTILKENKVGGLTLFDFKTSYKAIVIKKVWYKDRNIDQGNRTESLEINLYIYMSIDFWQGTKTSHWGKNRFINK